MKQENMGKTRGGVSRRGFLQGASAIAAAGALAGMTGCSPSQGGKEGSSEAGSQAAGSAHSWDSAPEPITDVKEIVDADVVVVGAGVAGLSTACSAAEQGLKVVVVEKSGAIGPNRTFGGAGSRLMDSEGVKIDKSFAQEQWNRTCGNRADEALVNEFFDKSEEALNWVLDKADKYGAKVMLLPINAANSRTYPEAHCQHIATGGLNAEEGESSLNVLINNDCAELGVQFAFNSPAVQLVQSDGAVTGCICKAGDGYMQYNASKGVVLATGDIGGDLEMVKAYCPIVAPLVENGMTIYETDNNTGDGHKMGMWAGAVMQDSPLPPMIHPEIYCKMSPGSSLAVNKEGKRFFNEGTWMQGRSLNIMRQTDYTAYWILDGNWHEGYMKGLEVGGGIWWSGFNDEAAAVKQIEGYIEKGLAWKADTLDDLADQMGVDKAEFAKTIERYNELAEGGEDLDYRKNPVLLTPYKTPPFYGLKVGASLLVIVGGLNVDLNSQCVDANKQPIPGLFAVGNVQGGLFANDYPLYIAGCSVGRCITFGYEVGKYLAML